MFNSWSAQLNPTDLQFWISIESISTNKIHRRAFVGWVKALQIFFCSLSFIKKCIQEGRHLIKTQLHIINGFSVFKQLPEHSVDYVWVWVWVTENKQFCKSYRKAPNLSLTCSCFQIFWHFAFEWNGTFDWFTHCSRIILSLQIFSCPEQLNRWPCH